jgi:hypothetical protein
MVNQFQESLLLAERTQRVVHALHLGLIQAAIAFVLVLGLIVFGLFSAALALGAESETALANVLPIVLSENASQPGLDWTVATGDGGATILP